MTRDRIYAAELDHDTSGASDREVEACMGEAMDSIVDDVMSGKNVPGRFWGLHYFIHDQPDTHELVAAAIISGDYVAMRDEIERRLRDDLADSDAVHDRAVQIATGGERE